MYTLILLHKMARYTEIDNNLSCVYDDRFRISFNLEKFGQMVQLNTRLLEIRIERLELTQNCMLSRINHLENVLNKYQNIRYKSLFTRDLRHFVLSRDNFKCVNCGVSNKESSLHLHHKQNLQYGGDNSPDNLETLCFKCHIAKNGKI